MPGLKIMAELGGDGTGFQAMMNRAGSKVGEFKSLMAQAFTVGAVTQLIRKTTDYADRIEETSTRLGIATDKLQEWEYAAKQSGASAERLLNFIEKLTLAASDPAKLKFFEQMGFNPAGMTPEGIFGKTAAFAKQAPAPELTRILSELVGVRISGTLVNTLKSDLDAMGEQARKVGAVMDQQTIQALSKLNDQFSILSQILYSNFGPALLEVGKILLTAFHSLKGGAAAVGARTSWIQGKDLVAALGVLSGNIPGQLKGSAAVGRILRDWEKGKGLGENELTSAMESLDEQLAALERATPFIPSPVQLAETGAADKAGKAPRGVGLVTDALVGVGNFLGRNPALIQDIAAQQLEISRRQLEVQQQLLQEFRSRWGARDTLEVPAL